MNSIGRKKTSSSSLSVPGGSQGGPRGVPGGSRRGSRGGPGGVPGGLEGLVEFLDVYLANLPDANTAATPEGSLSVHKSALPKAKVAVVPKEPISNQTVPTLFCLLRIK